MRCRVYYKVQGWSKNYSPFGLRGRERKQSRVEQIQSKISLFLTNSTLLSSITPPSSLHPNGPLELGPRDRSIKEEKNHYEISNKHQFNINKSLTKTKTQNYCFLIYYNAIIYEKGAQCASWMRFCCWVKVKLFCLKYFKGQGYLF